MASSKKIPATLIPGDGIGPEIMDAVLAVLDAVEAPSSGTDKLADLRASRPSAIPCR